jgi:hypothetical protein
MSSSSLLRFLLQIGILRAPLTRRGLLVEIPRYVVGSPSFRARRSRLLRSSGLIVFLPSRLTGLPVRRRWLGLIVLSLCPFPFPIVGTRPGIASILIARAKGSLILLFALGILAPPLLIL